MPSEAHQEGANLAEDTISEEDELLTSSEIEQEGLNLCESYNLERGTEDLFQISSSEYTAGRNADVRGTANPSLIDKPFWKYMIRLGGDAYSARMSFKTPEDPCADVHLVWCFGRFGATRTKLPDGRIVCIGGEHEDPYDPDFYIYNGKNMSSTGPMAALTFPNAFCYYDLWSFPFTDTEMTDVVVIAPPQPGEELGVLFCDCQFLSALLAGS